MPQLDKVTFLSQFFWLCFFYLGFYYVLMKYFLPKISRILALRKRKLSLSHQAVSGAHQESQALRSESDALLSKALANSKEGFQNVFAHTTTWLDTTADTVNKTQYKPINTSYIDFLGESSLAQNIFLYHAAQAVPEKLLVKIFMEKTQNLKSQKSFKKSLVS